MCIVNPHLSEPYLSGFFTYTDTCLGTSYDYIYRKWLTYRDIHLSRHSASEPRCPDEWGSTVYKSFKIRFSFNVKQFMLEGYYITIIHLFRITLKNISVVSLCHDIFPFLHIYLLELKTWCIESHFTAYTIGHFNAWLCMIIIGFI